MTNDVVTRRTELVEGILPCPFCGRSDTLARENLAIVQKTNAFAAQPRQVIESFAYACRDCNFIGPVGGSKEVALEKWNKRSEKVIEV